MSRAIATNGPGIVEIPDSVDVLKKWMNKVFSYSLMYVKCVCLHFVYTAFSVNFIYNSYGSYHPGSSNHVSRRFFHIKNNDKKSWYEIYIFITIILFVPIDDFEIIFPYNLFWLNYCMPHNQSFNITRLVIYQAIYITTVFRGPLIPQKWVNNTPSCVLTQHSICNQLTWNLSCSLHM